MGFGEADEPLDFTGEAAFDQIDRSIAGWMERYGYLLLRFSLGVVFIWFGLLKPLDLSPGSGASEEDSLLVPTRNVHSYPEVVGGRYRVGLAVPPPDTGSFAPDVPTDARNYDTARPAPGGLLYPVSLRAQP